MALHKYLNNIIAYKIHSFNFTYINRYVEDLTAAFTSRRPLKATE